jgi:hypothetical protein
VTDQLLYRDLHHARLERHSSKIVSSTDIKDSLMARRFSFAILAVVSALAVVDSISPAAAAQDQYCLQGRRWGYPGNCQFSSYAQCMATASGTVDYCGINPHYAFALQRRGVYRDRY